MYFRKNIAYAFIVLVLISCDGDWKRESNQQISNIQDGWNWVNIQEIAMDEDNWFEGIKELEVFLGKNSKTTNNFGELYLCIYEDRYCDSFDAENILWVTQEEITVLKSDKRLLYDYKTLKSIIDNTSEIEDFMNIIDKYLIQIDSISNSSAIMENLEEINSFTRLAHISRALEIYYMLSNSKVALNTFKTHTESLTQILNKESSTLITYRWRLILFKEQLSYLERILPTLTPSMKGIYLNIISDLNYSFLSNEFKWETKMNQWFIQRDMQEIEELRDNIIKI